MRDIGIKNVLVDHLPLSMEVFRGFKLGLTCLTSELAHLDRTVMPGWLCNGRETFAGRQKIPMEMSESSCMCRYVIGGALQPYKLLQ